MKRKNCNTNFTGRVRGAAVLMTALLLAMPLPANAFSSRPEGPRAPLPEAGLSSSRSFQLARVITRNHGKRAARNRNRAFHRKGRSFFRKPDRFFRDPKDFFRGHSRTGRTRGARSASISRR